MLPICFDLLTRIFFITTKIIWDNIGWFLVFLAIGLILSRSPTVLGFVVEGINAVNDLLVDVIVGTGGIFGFLGGIFAVGVLSVVVGLFFSLLVLFSQTNLILRIIAFPFYFALGFAYGLFPIPLFFGVVSALMARNRTLATIICIAPIALIVLIQMAGFVLPCEFLDGLIIALQ